MKGSREIRFRCIDCKHYDYDSKMCLKRNVNQPGAGTPACKLFELAELGERLVRRYKIALKAIRSTFGSSDADLTVSFEGRIYTFERCGDGIRIIDITDVGSPSWSEEKATIGVFKLGEAR